MKVSELMAILAKCDPGAEVVMPDGIPLVSVGEVEDTVVLSDYDGDESLEDFAEQQGTMYEHNGRYWE